MRSAKDEVTPGPRYPIVDCRRVLGTACVLALGLIVLCGTAVARADSVPGDTAAADSAQPAYRVVEAGPVRVAARLAPRKRAKSLTVGDRFTVELEVRRPRGLGVSEPFPEGDEIASGRFAVTDRKSVTRYAGDTTVETHKLEMAAFATGSLALPRFAVTWRGENEVLAARSDSLAVDIASVMPEDMKDIKDLKPQIPFPNLLPLWLMLGVLGLTTLVFFGLRLLRQLRRRRQAEASLPDPWDEALAALERIAGQGWLEQGAVKRHYYAVSEVLKRYLTRRYGFPALDQTTSEMVLAMRRARVDAREEFTGFFRRADMVKYAKLVPPADEMLGAAGAARQLVEKTTPKPAAEDDRQGAKEQGPRGQASKGSSEDRPGTPSSPASP